MEPINESGLGFFLKSERERKGLTLEHVAKLTRLRTHYIEALENEDWGKLPSLVFIRGFVKNYTKALGLDYKEVMGQFGSSVPVHDDLPKPLVPLKKTNKKYYFWGFLVIFILSLFIVFLIGDPLSLFKKAGSTSTKGRNDKVVQQEANPEADRLGQLSGQDSAVNNPQAANTTGATTKPETGYAGIKIQPSGPDAASRKMTAGNTVKTPVQETDLKPVVGVNEKYTLTGYVTSSTYIKIYVDNDEPKEYIFSPGSYPQWRGNEGFYVLVGNAAGIEFDLNGKRIKNLGGQGDVVRLRLPDNFNLNINE
jgi:cytoskeleton protein RodZ